MNAENGEKQRVTAEQVGLQTLWSLVHGSPLAIFAVDRDATVLVWNPAAERLFGWDEQDVLGETNPIVPEGRGEEFRRLRERAIAGEVYTGMEVRVGRKDGSPVDISVSTAPLRDELGIIIGLMAVVADISERRRMEEALRDSLQKSRRIFDETIHALAEAVEMRDPYTAGHQRRVARLACAIAGEMSLPADRINGIRTAAIVHDIGKLSVPVEILSKPGRLSEAEQSLLKTHPQAGYEILDGIEFPWPIARIVQQHHERIDGSGYPLGLQGDEILLEAQILTVADVVEATSSYRPYRPANGIAVALAEITAYRCSRYDPDIVDACLGLFNKGFMLE
ncbi:MAG: PAS domain S-box protein [Proteobacteria bacterium]|nr:PAS domain S-box protein [Pseudomonadota bacterium]